MVAVGPILWMSSSVLWSMNALLYKYRHREKKALKEKAIIFLSKGILGIPTTITFEEKHQSWFKYLLPQLINHWKVVVAGFDIDNVVTWPHPKNGRAYETTLQQANDTGLRPLFSSNYEIQSLIYYILDPSFRLCTFRTQTHWKLYLLMTLSDALINIFNKCIHYFTNQYDIFSLEVSKYAVMGSDTAWYLPNWPCEDPVNLQKPWHRNTHIDSGYENYYSYGVPISLIEEDVLKGVKAKQDAVALRVFFMVMKMIGIIFRYDTPSLAPIQPVHGTTGLFPYSPIMLLAAFQLFLSQRQREGGEETTHLSFAAFNECLKRFGEQYHTTTDTLLLPELQLLQPTVQYNEVMIAFGMMLHTSMWSIHPILCPSHHHDKQTMIPMPRILENAKIHLQGEYFDSPSKMMTLFDELPSESLLKQVITAPIEFLTTYCYDSDARSSCEKDEARMVSEAMVQEIQHRSEYLAELFATVE